MSQTYYAIQYLDDDNALHLITVRDEKEVDFLKERYSFYSVQKYVIEGGSLFD